MAWSLTTTQIPESIEHFMSIIGYYTISKPLISSNISELFFVVKQYESTSLKRYTELGGGFKHFLFSPLLGEMIQFDWYFSDGLKPPTRLKKSRIFKTYSQKKEAVRVFGKQKSAKQLRHIWNYKFWKLRLAPLTNLKKHRKWNMRPVGRLEWIWSMINWAAGKREFRI